VATESSDEAHEKTEGLMKAKGKGKGQKRLAAKKMAIKDLPTKPAREDAVRGGAEPVGLGRIKKS
jgi:hypothetical protein